MILRMQATVMPTGRNSNDQIQARDKGRDFVLCTVPVSRGPGGWVSGGIFVLVIFGCVSDSGVLASDSCLGLMDGELSSLLLSREGGTFLRREERCDGF